MLDEMLKANKILLLEGGAVNVQEAPFPRHRDPKKAHVMMACHSTASVEPATPEGEPSVDQ